MIILAFDPGIGRTGYALFKKKAKETAYISSGMIETAKTTEKKDRLLVIFNECEKIIKKHRPEIVVFEKLFFFKNQKTVISVAQAQGVIITVAAKNNLKVESLSPLQIKETVTGYGRADKKAIKKMIQITTKIKIDKMIDDEIDAIACGLAYCQLNKNSTP